jgi:diacylglycerol kinase family enzyme
LSIVVLVNPRSRSSRRDPAVVNRFAAILGDAGRVVAPGSLEDLQREASALAAAPPAVVGVHGGDGTLHRSVGALIQAFAGKALPTIAILTGGTMNVVASSLGIRVSPRRLLREVVTTLRAGQAPETVTRRCLQVGQSFGFVFGNGLMANFLEEYYASGGYGAGRALYVLGRTFLSGLARGPYARKVFRRFRGRVTVDGEVLPWSELTGIAAGTVREVGLGFKLNHRADEDPDRFSLLAIHGGAVTLAADLLPVHQGRGIDPTRAWSALASRVLIEPEEPGFGYTIDGDLYRGEGNLEVGLGPALRFVRPAPAR